MFYFSWPRASPDNLADAMGCNPTVYFGDAPRRAGANLRCDDGSPTKHGGRGLCGLPDLCARLHNVARGQITPEKNPPTAHQHVQSRRKGAAAGSSTLHPNSPRMADTNALILQVVAGHVKFEWVWF